MNISNYIRSIDNFPSKGIIFRDISPIFQNPNILNYVVEEMNKYIDKLKPDYLAAIDSRGFYWDHLWHILVKSLYIN